jgi:predicted aspartyl protease
VRRVYSHAFSPPAPVVTLLVSAPDGDVPITIEGKIDSGADICAVPDRLVAELGLPIVRTIRAAGFAGELRETVVYEVDVQIEGIVHDGVEALATRRPYVIVGRNVLNTWIAKLDGPAERLDLTRGARPRSRRRKS